MKIRRLIAKIADQIYFVIMLVIIAIVISIAVTPIILSVDSSVVNTDIIMNSRDMLDKLVEYVQVPKHLFLLYFIGGIVQLISLFAYFTIGYFLNGSPGKYLMKLRVIDENGDRPKFLIFLIREPMIIRGILVFFSTIIGCSINLYFSNTVSDAIVNFLLTISSPLTIYMLFVFAFNYDFWCKYTKTKITKY